MKYDKLNVSKSNGKRIGETEIPKGEDEERWRKIFKADYISLDELYPEKASISQKLQWLDEMCQREEAAARKND